MRPAEYLTAMLGGHARQPLWRRIMRRPKVYTHKFTPPPKLWTPLEHPNCRSSFVPIDVEMHGGGGGGGRSEVIDFRWPYACHRHGHIYRGDTDRCGYCGIPWAVENPVVATTHAYMAGEVSRLMLDSVIRREYGNGVGV